MRERPAISALLDFTQPMALRGVANHGKRRGHLSVVEGNLFVLRGVTPPLVTSRRSCLEASYSMQSCGSGGVKALKLGSALSLKFGRVPGSRSSFIEAAAREYDQSCHWLSKSMTLAN